MHCRQRNHRKYCRTRSKSTTTKELKKEEAEEELISAATMIYILSAIVCYILFLLIGAQQERLELKLLVAITELRYYLQSQVFTEYGTCQRFNHEYRKHRLYHSDSFLIKVIALTNGLSILIVGMADITGLAAMTILLKQKVDF